MKPKGEALRSSHLQLHGLCVRFSDRLKKTTNSTKSETEDLWLRSRQALRREQNHGCPGGNRSTPEVPCECSNASQMKWTVSSMTSATAARWPRDGAGAG